MYKVYIENNVILFVEQEPTDPENEALRMHINLNDTFSITKLLQKLQFTKKLYLISDDSSALFEQFCSSLRFIEAGGGWVTDRSNRILMIFDPTIDPQGASVRWHTLNSLASLQGGGMTGQGLFHGSRTQTGGLLFAQHTDFVFSAIGEELGMVGCLLVLLLLTAIVLRCIYVGVKSGSYMNRLICIGIAATFMFQIIVNTGMCMGVFPVIGLTLPFISYGGSSLVTTFAAVGIVSGIRMRPAPDSSARYIRPAYTL